MILPNRSDYLDIILQLWSSEIICRKRDVGTVLLNKYLVIADISAYLIARSVLDSIPEIHETTLHIHKFARDTGIFLEREISFLKQKRNKFDGSNKVYFQMFNKVQWLRWINCVYRYLSLNFLCDLEIIKHNTLIDNYVCIF